MYLHAKFHYFLVLFGFFLLPSRSKTHQQEVINPHTVFNSLLSPDVLEQSSDYPLIQSSCYENLETKNTFYVPQGYMISSSTCAHDFFCNIPLQHSTVFDNLHIPPAHTRDINHSLSRIKGIRPIKN